MRRITKSALVMVGAAAATFAVVSQFAGSPTAVTPAAKTKAVCEQPAPNAKAIVLVPVDISLPTLPTLPPVTLPNVTLPTLPCIPAPTIPPVGLPNITLPTVTLPTVTLPTVTLPTIPDITIPYPRFVTTTTTNGCQTSLSDVKAGATIC